MAEIHYPVPPRIQDFSLFRSSPAPAPAAPSGALPTAGGPAGASAFLHEHWFAIAIGATIILVLVLAALFARGYSQGRDRHSSRARQHTAGPPARGGDSGETAPDAPEPPDPPPSELDRALAERRSQRETETRGAQAGDAKHSAPGPNLAGAGSEQPRGAAAPASTRPAAPARRGEPGSQHSEAAGDPPSGPGPRPPARQNRTQPDTAPAPAALPAEGAPRGEGSDSVDIGEGDGDFGSLLDDLGG